MQEHEFAIHCRIALTPARFLYAVTAASAHLAVVEYHKCSRLNQIGQVRHGTVHDVASLAVQAHKFILTAHPTRFLRDEFFR